MENILIVEKDPLVEEKTMLPIHTTIYDKLDFFFKSNKIPHLIFHGASGSGKRTIVNNFLNKIYNNDKHKIKSNVMFVNCAHGKGIKFIREELKFFAKTNIQSNNGVIFKTIVLLNADQLTIDAQSALRRCIELFSYNTRFFIIVENKHKLLNPILSRFCEIYVPDHVENDTIINLHQYSIMSHYSIKSHMNEQEWINDSMARLDKNEITHEQLTCLATEFYEKGLSCLDLIQWVKSTSTISAIDKSTCCMCFDKIKSEFRCEKLLLLYIFDFLYLRLNKDLKCITSI
jgi:GTPase SAR1 family protein